MATPSIYTLLPLAFSAGAATFFAPCAFPLLPGYVSYFVGETASRSETSGTTEPAGSASEPTAEPATSTGGPAESAGSRATNSGVVGLVGGGGTVVEQLRSRAAQAAVIGGVASAGMVSVYVLLAGTAVVLGASALSDVAVFELVVGGVFVVGGLAMATGWKPSGTIVQLPERRRSVSGIFLFGALYAVAAAGCTAPLFLAVVLQGVAVGPVAGAGVAVTYALGMGSVMLVVAGLSVAGSSLVERLGRHTGRLYRLAGGLLVVSGLAEIYYYVRGFPAVIPA